LPPPKHFVVGQNILLSAETFCCRPKHFVVSRNILLQREHYLFRRARPKHFVLADKISFVAAKTLFVGVNIFACANTFLRRNVFVWQNKFCLCTSISFVRGQVFNYFMSNFLSPGFEKSPQYSFSS